MTHYILLSNSTEKFSASKLQKANMNQAPLPTTVAPLQRGKFTRIFDLIAYFAILRIQTSEPNSIGVVYT